MQHFGGSVAALRLAQKGYSVRVLGSGSRFRDEDFAGSTWDARRYFFAPRLGLRGIIRMTLLPEVLIVSGAGVGGGSLGMRTRSTAPATRSSRTHGGVTWPTGRPTSPRTTTLQSGCSA
jgi:cholesterol oxidase